MMQRKELNVILIATVSIRTWHASLSIAGAFVPLPAPNFRLYAMKLGPIGTRFEEAFQTALVQRIVKCY
jgi:hypothetical protein